MPAGLPDWHRSVRLTGKYGLQLIPVAVDENGNLYAVIKGTDGTELRTVKLDVDGSILAKLVGGTVNVGTITTVEDKDRNIKGYDGADYRAIAVDSNGIMLARLKGFDGSQLRDVLVDDEGRIVGVFKGRYTNPFDLVLDLPFDEGEGSVAYDQSLYGNNGTIYGATWTRGRSGWALDFDGTDDYVEIPDGIINATDRNFTIVATVLTRVLDDAVHTIYYNGAESGVFSLRLHSTNEFALRVRLDDGNWYGAYGPAEKDVFTHLVGVRRGATLELWVNGELKASTLIPDKDLYVTSGYHASASMHVL